MSDIDTNSPSHNPIQCMNCGNGPCIFPTLCGEDALKGPQKPNGNGHAHSNGHAKTSVTRPFNYLKPSQFSDPKKDWLIKGVMARGEVTSWFGAPGATKSMLLTDVFVALGNRNEWRGHAVKGNCASIYFAMERHLLTQRRITAYRVLDRLHCESPVVVPDVINLMDPRVAARIIDTVHAVEDDLQMPVGALGFDSFNKGIAAGGGDENLAQHQNLVAANMKRVLERLDVHIAGIGHSGKNVLLGERGSNARMADVDVRYAISGIEGIFRASVDKANDQDEGPITSYTIMGVELGLDEDDEPITTFIINPAAAPERGMAERSVQPRSGAQKIMLQALAQAIDENGVSVCSNNVPLTAKCVTVAMWRLYYKQRYPADEDPLHDFARGKDSLIGNGFVGSWGEHVWLP